MISQGVSDARARAKDTMAMGGLAFVQVSRAWMILFMSSDNKIMHVLYRVYLLTFVNACFVYDYECIIERRPNCVCVCICFGMWVCCMTMWLCVGKRVCLCACCAKIILLYAY